MNMGAVRENIIFEKKMGKETHPFGPNFGKSTALFKPTKIEIIKFDPQLNVIAFLVVHNTSYTFEPICKTSSLYMRLNCKSFNHSEIMSSISGSNSNDTAFLKHEINV